MYFENAFNNIFLTVNITDVGSNNGSSILPFIGFMLFLFGIVIIFVGLILTNAAKREWNVFYAPHDLSSQVDNKTKKKKSVVKGRVVYILGIVMLVASYFVK